MKRRTKRKIKKFFSKNLVLVLSVSLISSVFLLSTAYSLLNQNLELTGNSEIITSENPDLEDVCKGSISYERTFGWGGTHVVDVTITNLSDDLMYSWVLKLTNIEGITGITGPVNTTVLNDTYYMTPQDYKAPIKKGESQTITLQVNTEREVDDIFQHLTLVDCGQDTDHSQTVITSGGAYMKLGTYEKQLEATAVLESAGNWDGNHYKITIKNTTEKTFEGWRAILYYGDETYVSIYNYYTYNEEPENKRLSLYSNQPFTSGATVEFFVVINTTIEDYLPDIVAAGLIVE